MKLRYVLTVVGLLLALFGCAWSWLVSEPANSMTGMGFVLISVVAALNLIVLLRRH